MVKDLRPLCHGPRRLVVTPDKIREVPPPKQKDYIIGFKGLSPGWRRVVAPPTKKILETKKLLVEAVNVMRYLLADPGL